MPAIQLIGTAQCECETKAQNRTIRLMKLCVEIIWHPRVCFWLIYLTISLLWFRGIKASVVHALDTDTHRFMCDSDTHAWRQPHHRVIMDGTQQQILHYGRLKGQTF